MPCHAFDASLTREIVFMSQQPLQYLACRTCVQSMFFSVSSLQQSFARNAELTCLIQCSPRPPSSLFLVIISQETLCIARWFSVPPHKNLLDFRSISLHIDLGSFAICIVNDGMVDMVVWTNISLPALDRSRDLHPASLLSTRFMILWNVCFATRPLMVHTKINHQYLEFPV